DQLSAEAYLDMHSARLKEMVVSEVRGVIFDVNQPLTTINKGPVNS
ncbi:YdhR family protein, partial [Vibrio fortis]